VIRSLTEGEAALAGEMFGEAMRLETIRMVAAPWPEFRAFVAGAWFGRAWGGWPRSGAGAECAGPGPVFGAFGRGRGFGRDRVVWPRAGGRADFAAGTVRRQSVFIHELTHVWQSQAGVRLARAKLKAGFSDAAYRYPDAPCHWDALNIEQQAMVVQHRFLASRGVNVPMAHAHFDRLCPLAKRMEI